jgi:hypothetical protein|tara:strand:+ start:745 stop:1008 length:264 start_codon:yes stop_codon:yes gene_type:complete
LACDPLGVDATLPAGVTVLDVPIILSLIRPGILLTDLATDVALPCSTETKSQYEVLRVLVLATWMFSSSRAFTRVLSGVIRSSASEL